MIETRGAIIRENFGKSKRPRPWEGAWPLLVGRSTMDDFDLCRARGNA